MGKRSVEEGLAEPPAGPSQDERTWAMVAVLSPLVGYVIPIPFVNIIAPLVIYFMKRDESAFVAFHALQTVYFSIAVFLAVVISIVLLIVCVGLFLLIVIAIASIVYLAVIAIKAYQGEWAEFWLVGEWARRSVER